MDVEYSHRTLKKFSANPDVHSFCVASGTVAIGEWVFEGNEGLTEVTLPPSVKRIKTRAFKNCKNLESINLEYVEEIESEAFYNCKKLQATLSPQVQIGVKTFHNCKKISDSKGFIITSGILLDYFGNDKEPVIPDCVTKIGREAFAENKRIESIVIPDSVQEIDERAFSNCPNLKTVRLPEMLKQLNHGVFSNCSSLETVNIPLHIEQLSLGAFTGCTMLTEIAIPDNPQISICCSNGIDYLTGCQALKELYIPCSIDGRIKVSDCDNLYKIHAPYLQVGQFDSAKFSSSSLDDQVGPVLLKALIYGFEENPQAYKGEVLEGYLDQIRKNWKRFLPYFLYRDNDFILNMMYERGIITSRNIRNPFLSSAKYFHAEKCIALLEGIIDTLPFSDADASPSDYHVSFAEEPVQVKKLTDHAGTLAAGDVISFGSYPSNAFWIIESGKKCYWESLSLPEPVTWKVLDIKDHKALLITEKAIEMLPYEKFERVWSFHTSPSPTSWKNCSLRKELNTRIQAGMLGKDERRLLCLPSPENQIDEKDGVSGTKGTKDLLFILTQQEYEKYFPDNESSGCFSTKYALSQYQSRDERPSDITHVWLRNQGEKKTEAFCCDTLDHARPIPVNIMLGIRPACWVQIES